MKKKCTYHQDLNIKVFCTEDSCQAYRLLCLKCTISPTMKEQHKTHNLMLIEDLFHNLERIKTQKASLSHYLPRTTSQANSLKNETANNTSLLSVSEISETLRLFRAFQKVLSESPPTKPLEVTEVKNEPVKIEYCEPEESSLPSSESADGLQSIDFSKVTYPSLGVFLTEKVIVKARSNDYCKVQDDEVSEDGDSIDMPLKNQKRHHVKQEGVAEKLHNKRAASASKKQQTTPWETHSKRKKNQPSTQSCNRSQSNKALDEVNSAHMTASEVSRFDIGKKCIKTEAKSCFEEENLGTKKSKRKAAPKKKKELKYEIKLEIALPENASALEQLRYAISRLDNSNLMSVAKDSSPKEEEMPARSKKSTCKQSPLVLASDIYDEDQLEEEVRCLLKEEVNSVRAQALRKQITGFKEFSLYRQKNSVKTLKVKQLKEEWKELSKKEREQWESIAVRKRIHLRDQLDLLEKNTASIAEALEKSSKKVKKELR